MKFKEVFKKFEDKASLFANIWIFINVLRICRFFRRNLNYKSLNKLKFSYDLDLKIIINNILINLYN